MSSNQVLTRQQQIKGEGEKEEAEGRKRLWTRSGLKVTEKGSVKM